MSVFIKHKLCMRSVALMIPLLLVFVGIRVPDFSRLHKPKPVRQATLDKTPNQTENQSIVKNGVDPVISSLLALVFLTEEKKSPEAQSFHSSVSFLSLSPLSPRAPPTLNHLM